MNKKKWMMAALALAMTAGCAAQETKTEDKKEETSETEAAAEETISLAGNQISAPAHVQVQDTIATITRAGTYTITGSLDDGQIVVAADKEADVNLVLDNVSIVNDASAALYIKSAKNVTVTLQGENSLTSNGFTQIDDNEDAALFSKDDLILEGEGSLTISSAGHGIAGKDDVSITDGTYDITAQAHGIQAKDSLEIDNGTFTINSQEDAIHAKNKDDGTGDIHIQNGTFTLNAKEDAIHAESALTIDNGTFDIQESYEGLEAASLTINDGTFRIVASDDGLNAASDTISPCDITVAGGNISIIAGGDAIDANGSFTMTGGQVNISGPNTGDTSILDYDGTATISKGTFLAAGASQMAQNFSQDSSQPSILYCTESHAAGDKITLTDSQGKELVSFTPVNDYSCILISTKDLKKGETYTLKAGEDSYEITMDSNTYSNFNGRGQGVMGQPGGMGPGAMRP